MLPGVSSISGYLLSQHIPSSFTQSHPPPTSLSATKHPSLKNLLPFITSLKPNLDSPGLDPSLTEALIRDNIHKDNLQERSIQVADHRHPLRHEHLRRLTTH
jgi:hypothetical protein